jgi:hypothetical protein
MDKNFYFVEILDEEYKGRIFPFDRDPEGNINYPQERSLKFYDVSGEYISVLPSIMRDGQGNILQRNGIPLRNGYAEDFSKFITERERIQYKFMAVNINDSARTDGYTTSRSYLTINKYNMSFYSVPNVDTTLDSILFYFMLDTEESIAKDNIKSEIEQKISINLSDRNIINTFNFNALLYPVNLSPQNALYLRELKVLINPNTGDIIGSADFTMNPDNTYTINNVITGIYVDYVHSIEKLGFIIKDNMNIILPNDEMILYINYKISLSTKAVLLFKKDSDGKMILISAPIDFSKNYKIISSGIINFRERLDNHNREKLEKFDKHISLYRNVLSAYGMAKYLPQIQGFDMREAPSQEEIDDARDYYDAYGFYADPFNLYRKYYRDNPVSIDQNFIDTMLTQEIPINLTDDITINHLILKQLNLDRLISVTNFNEQAKQIVNTKDFVLNYLDEYKYPLQIIGDKRDDESYLEFLVYIISHLNEIKKVPNNIYSTGRLDYHTLSYLVNKTNILNGKIESYLIPFLLEDGKYQLLEDIIKRKIFTDQHITEHLIKDTIIDYFIKNNLPDLLDHFVKLLEVTLNDEDFYSARGRNMVLHLINTYDLPNN